MLYLANKKEIHGGDTTRLDEHIDTPSPPTLSGSDKDTYYTLK